MWPCRMSSGGAALLIGLFSVILVSANLCDQRHIQSWHTEEAEQLEKEPYSAGSNCAAGSTTCYIGTRSYNARVLGCNHKRDSNGNKIDKNMKNREYMLSPDLPPRSIEGRYSFFGISLGPVGGAVVGGVLGPLGALAGGIGGAGVKKWYGYTLERSGGTWIVTAILDFKLPEAEKDKLHISRELQMSLTTTLGGTADLTTSVCASNAVGSGNGIVSRPFSQPCRVDRSARFFLVANPVLPLSTTTFGTLELPVTEWLFHSWRALLVDRYNRPGFQLKVQIANFAGRTGEITETALKAAKKVDTVFEVEFHHKEGRGNNMFRPIEFLGIKIYKAIYAGEERGVCGHEFGHSLGLDDDYHQAKDEAPDQNCDKLTGFSTANSQNEYMMCGNMNSVSAFKSVYAWIVTQRYAIGKDVDRQCRANSDCDPGEYCDKGTLSIGKNSCRPRRVQCSTCSANDQCLSGMECHGTKCITKNALNHGDSCCQDAECIKGTCQNNKCACFRDDDCGPSMFCKNLPLSRNICVSGKNICDSCTQNDQCKPNTCKGGRCIKENDVALGGSCCKDAQCKTGKCKDDRCVCKENSDCGSDGTRFCEKDRCVSRKNECEKCSHDGDCKSGGGMQCKGSLCIKEGVLALGQQCCHSAQCRKGKCESGECVCSKNEDCDGNQKCKQPLGKKNTCE